MRTATITMDLSDILPADLEQRVKDAAQISMGTEVSDSDVEHISCLCDQVKIFRNYNWEMKNFNRTESDESNR